MKKNVLPNKLHHIMQVEWNRTYQSTPVDFNLICRTGRSNALLFLFSFYWTHLDLRLHKCLRRLLRFVILNELTFSNRTRDFTFNIPIVIRESVAFDALYMQESLTFLLILRQKYNTFRLLSWLEILRHAIVCLIIIY